MIPEILFNKIINKTSHLTLEAPTAQTDVLSVRNLKYKRHSVGKIIVHSGDYYERYIIQLFGRYYNSFYMPMPDSPISKISSMLEELNFKLT